jgi:hypothetical protein
MTSFLIAHPAIDQFRHCNALDDLNIMRFFGVAVLGLNVLGLVVRYYMPIYAARSITKT